MSYTLVEQWSDGFQGEFTIVNSGSTPVNGWELSVDLPGDQVDLVWYAYYHMAGDTLIMQPPPFQQQIAPGATLTERFIAHGTATSPANCTFNGSPC